MHNAGANEVACRLHQFWSPAIAFEEISFCRNSNQRTGGEMSRTFQLLKETKLMMKKFCLANFVNHLLSTSLVLLSLVAFANTDKSSSTKTDNTRHNQRDQKDGAVTADQQSNERGDLDLTRRIRRDLTRDESLSTYAHNVKIITARGVVTLKGPVRSEAEKMTILKKAQSVAGATKVHDEMEIATE